MNNHRYRRSLFLPIRGGDVVRCFLIAREPSLSTAGTTLGTLGIEKIFDGLALFAVVVIGCLFLSPPQWVVHVEV
jgi:hypothetical protein